MVAKGSRKLKVSTPSDTEILMQRVFDAPRHLVWEAMTRPDLVRRWWCCMEGYTMPVCEIDFRVGGKWRYVMVGAGGDECGFHGEYREIDAPKRIVNTEIFEPFPDAPTVCTMTLEEIGGKTYYQTRIVHLTKEGRDGQIQSGMEYGADIALDRLDEVALSLVGAKRDAGAAVARVPAGT